MSSIYRQPRQTFADFIASCPVSVSDIRVSRVPRGPQDRITLNGRLMTIAEYRESYARD